MIVKIPMPGMLKEKCCSSTVILKPEVIRPDTPQTNSVAGLLRISQLTKEELMTLLTAASAMNLF